MIIPGPEKRACELYSQIVLIEFKGVISEKYRREHDMPFIKIDDMNSKSSFNLYYDRSGLYEFVSIGDSIFKMKQSNLVYITKTNCDTVFKLDYDCEVNR
jgi:hypothetical protein